MEVRSAEFVMSNSNVKGCPKAVIPEYAFIGRSNVGKSSLLNMITGRKKLAKTSSTPGKTRLINHFLLNKRVFPGVEEVLANFFLPVNIFNKEDFPTLLLPINAYSGITAFGQPLTLLLLITNSAERISISID